MLRIVLLNFLTTAFAVEKIYTTLLETIPGVNGSYLGHAVVFVTSSDTVAYAGWGTDLEPGLGPSNCTAVNGCGVHIHSGYSCDNETAQEGHFYAAPVTEDPWIDDRYSTNATGYATFRGIVRTGSVDVEGRAFIVHAQDGTRLACGTLSEYVFTNRIFKTQTAPLDGSGVEASITAVANTGSFGSVCFYGTATGLESNLVSYLVGGTDCQAENGCGAHVHAGIDCTDVSTQLGHYYDTETYPVDPWLEIGYLTTDMSGSAEFAECVRTGQSQYDERAFLIHNSAGNRVSCGLLGQDIPIRVETAAPTTPAPTPLTPSPTEPTTASPTTETAFPTEPTTFSPTPPDFSTAVGLTDGIWRVLVPCALLLGGFLV